MSNLLRISHHFNKPRDGGGYGGGSGGSSHLLQQDKATTPEAIAFYEVQCLREAIKRA
jgi:hypothetical protein